MSEDDVVPGADTATSDLPARIEEALARRDQIALQNKGRRLTFAVTAAALGPVTVLLLELHVVFWPTGIAAIVLISLELFALTSALAVSFWKLDQSHYRWLAERLRTELLRREKFLLFAGVGPYLGITQSIVALRVERRLATIDDDINDAFALLELADRAVTWRDALEDSRCAAALAEVPAVSTDLKNYLHERIISQRTWYARKSIEHAQHTWWLEGCAKITLTLAIIVAAIHLGYHGTAAGETDTAKLLTGSRCPSAHPRGGSHWTAVDFRMPASFAFVLVSCACIGASGEWNESATERRPGGRSTTGRNIVSVSADPGGDGGASVK